MIQSRLSSRVMSPASDTPKPNFLMGLLLGVVVGGLGAIAFTGGKKVPAKTQEEDHSTHAHAQPNSPAKLPEDHPPAGGGAGGAPPHAGGGADRGASSAAKSHFMKKFVKALTEPPENKWANGKYKPLLKDASNPLACANCHDPEKYNVEGMKAMDPGHHKVQRFRENPNFMVQLMRKWVARLNQLHADKLTKRVECADCHAIDPAESWAVLPPIMARFTAALTQKPRNNDPAPGWRPLLKDLSKGVKNCALCHGEIGVQMEKQAEQFLEKPHADRYVDDKAFMIKLMERWVKRLNTSAGDKLAKKVTCTDCHADDPR